MSPLLLVAATLSLFVRLHSAVGVERQQIKWFAYAAAASVSATSLAYIIPGLVDTPLYFSGIVILQRLTVALAGRESTLAVVASTLVIAALFNPLRRRIQSFIDRRFYRRKYHARKTLESFSAKLRDETDLNALSDDLVGVVREAMQPAHVSLWLRPEASPKGTQAG